MKILISAYACSPYKGSEPGVGWGFIRGLAAFHELCVISELSFKEDIDHYLHEHQDLPRVTFYYIPRNRNRVAERIWPPAYYWTYRRWHKEALRLARELHAKVNFDLSHQLTMVGFREPGYLWQLGLPFVWGPVGGMGLFPWRFLPKVGFYGTLYYLGYNFFNLMQMRFMHRPKLAALAAGGGLIAATPENRDAARVLWGCPSTVMAEVGLPRSPRAKVIGRNSDEPLRIIWTGQHTPGKALNLGMEALAAITATGQWELNVLGKGPCMEAWKKLSGQLGLASRCHFHGWTPREEALEVMSSAHVMLITSLRDLTSTVTIEALALGLPIVCLDHCGFSHVVDNTCGIKVPVTTPSEAVKGLSEALARLAGDEALRQRLSQGALDRARMFAWENKVEVLNRIYEARLREAEQVHKPNIEPPV